MEQRSQEWYELRSTRMTASHAQAIGANGKGLITYIRDKMCKLYSTNEEEKYTNKDMEYGIEQEPVARMLYEFETGNKVEKVGFVIYDDYVGCSPDGLVGDKGLIEIKCPSNKVYFDLLLDKKIDTKYFWQMQMQMLICDREWCDYVAYNPNFEQQLFTARLYRHEESIEKLKKGFATLIDKLHLTKSGAFSCGLFTNRPPTHCISLIFPSPS